MLPDYTMKDKEDDEGKFFFLAFLINIIVI